MSDNSAVSSRVAFYAALWVSIFIFVLTPAANAQVLYGALVGSVIDNSEAAIPGANVRIVNTGTGREWTLTTNATGFYSVSTISPGTYEITISHNGFRPFTRSGIVVNANTTVRSDVALELGAITESVHVSAQALELQTDRADVRDEIRSDQMRNSPIPVRRNFQSLLQTIPGFTPASGGTTAFGNPGGALIMQANGTNQSAVTYRVNGTISRDAWTPFQADYIPSLEAIEVVNVVTGSFDAEQGLAAGAAVNVQIKSGTNDLHGSGFWFHNDQHLNSRPYFLPSDQNKSKRILNQPGGTIGGPIKKNKLFYFASYEGTYDRQSGFSIGSVPTRLMRTGDFSESNTLIYDPKTGGANGSNRTAFANNMLPAARVSPIIQKLVDLTPLPNLNSGTNSNYFSTGSFTSDLRRFDTKFSWNAMDKLSLNARVGVATLQQVVPARFGKLEGAKVGSLGGTPGVTDSHQWNLTFSGVYTLSPSVVVDASFGYGSRYSITTPPNLDENLGLDFLGIPGTNGPTRDYGGWPNFTISGYDALGRSSGNTSPSLNNSTSSQFAANVSWMKGTHKVRFGIDSWRNYLRLTQPTGMPGEFDFTAGITGTAGRPNGSFNSYASFLLGLPQTIQIWRLTQPGTGVSPAMSLYVSDSWQTTRKLTVNMGVRWDYFSVPYRDTGQGFSIYDVNTNNLALCGYGNLPKNCGFTAGRKYFSPRMGIAYRLSDKFVIRTGYALSWDPADISRNTIKWYPNLLTASIAGKSTYDPVISIEQGLPSLPPPAIGDGNVFVPLNLQMETFDPKYRRSYVQSWNLTMEKNFGRGWIGHAAYVGTRSINLNMRFDENYSFVGGGTQSQVLFARFGRSGITANTSTHGWNGKYDSLQAVMQKQFAHGYMAKFSYTWSKTFWPFGSANGIGLGFSDNNPLYWDRVVHTLASSDCPHSFTATFAAELPFGTGKRWSKGGVGAALLGGWQLNGLFSAYSGTPLTVTASNSSLNAPKNTQTADLVKDTVAIYGNREGWFDPLAYAPVTAVRFGTSGFNQIRSPGLLNLDAGIFRNFKLTERFTLQFRTEAFNISNTPHFGNPGTNVSNLQLNSNGSIRSLNGFTEINSVQDTGRDGIDERVFRIALKLTF